MIYQFLTLLSVIGTWQYAGFHYDGRFYPNPNPDLVLNFTFNADSTSHLIWYRRNETGFCERRGVYSLDEDLLWQKVTWVNPANEASCAKDPDMQMGRESATRVRREGDELGFLLDLDGKDFVYLLKKIRP